MVRASISKRLLSIALSLILIVSLLPMSSLTAKAVSGSGTKDDPYIITTWSELQEAFPVNSSTYVKLGNDIKRGDNTKSISISNFKENHIDLNGYVIDGENFNKPIFEVARDGTKLVIEDSRPSADHGTNYSYCPYYSTKPIYVKGGIITGGSRGILLSASYDGSVGASVNHCGGTIYGNGVVNTPDHGAGVVISGYYKAYYYLNGGSIIGNVCSSYGAGISNEATAASVTLNAGSIYANRAGDKGGGVFNGSNCTLNVNGSFICYNTANYGGGVYNKGKMNLKESTIGFNTVTTSGGGIYENSDETKGGFLKVSDGFVSVMSNKKIGSTMLDDNVYLNTISDTNRCHITINSVLSSVTRIGVNVGSQYGLSNYITVNSYPYAISEDNFISDDDSYGIEKVSNNIKLTPKKTVTINAGNNMTKTEGSGAATQKVMPDTAITSVVYTANDGYYFPENYSVASVNGISVNRDSYNQITVSGTPTDNAEINLTATTAKAKETTPSATFTATGPSKGTLSDVTNTMKYRIGTSGDWNDIIGITQNITGLSAGTIQVYQPSTNADTKLDSDIQSISIDKAAAPSITVTDPTVAGGKGRINSTTAQEYSSNNGSTWVNCTSNQELSPGAYLVRVKATGTTLASDNASVTIKSKNATPNATFTANGTNRGTLNNVSNGMKYSLDGGSNWTAITGTSVNITSGVTTTSGIKVYVPGDGTTSIDSDVQTIAISKADTPNLSPTQPSTVGGKGSIPTTLSHQWSNNQTTWEDCDGELTNLEPGTYYVRVKANGTTLASDNQAIEIMQYVPAKQNQIISFPSNRHDATYGADPYILTASHTKGDGIVTYASSDTSVATVDNNGEVIIKKVGTAIITASASETALYHSASASYTLVVAPQRIAVPTANTGLKYNGSALVGVNPGNNYTVTNGSATDAGDYVATISLNDSVNYVWSDGTNSDKQVSWSIAQTDSYEDILVIPGTVQDISDSQNINPIFRPFGPYIINRIYLIDLLGLTYMEITLGVNVWFDVKDATNTMSAADKEKINMAKGDYTVGQLLDISLMKGVGNNSSVKVEQTNGKVKASIIIPVNLRKYGRKYAIIRVHNGVATIIPCSYDYIQYLLIFESDGYSSYAIIYKDEEPQNTDVTNDPTTNFAVLDTPATTKITESSKITKVSVVPKTEDDLYKMCFAIIIAVLVLLGSIIVAIRRRNGKNDL